MNLEIRQRIEQINSGKIPAGYNKRRWILYPNDWNYVKLNTCLSENKERNKDGVYTKDDVLSVSGESGVVNQIEFMGRSYAGESVLPYHVVETGDIVYTKSPLKQNPYGIIKLNKGNPGIVSTLYAVYHCNNPITAEYLNYFFEVDEYLNNYLFPLVKKGAKNDMKINNEDVIKGEIALPSIEEQEKIVKVLKQCDKIISLYQKEIDELQKLKKVYLKIMFPQNGENVPKLRFHQFITPWEQREFSNIAQRLSETAMSSAELPAIEYEDVVSGEGILNKDVTLKETQKIGIVFSEDNVIYGKLRPYLHNWLIPNFKGVAVGDWWVLKPINSDKNFVYRLIQSDNFDAIANQSTGTKMPRADWKLVSVTEFDVPTSIDEQAKIGTFFHHLDHIITLRRCKLDEKKKFKKSLMQLLLTGIVRVDV